jgi:hypothetical protein
LTIEAVSPEAVVWLAVLALMIAAIVAVGRRRGRSSYRPRAAASGAIYDLLNQDKRNALELIVEERAEARDPETADDKPATGN